MDAIVRLSYEQSLCLPIYVDGGVWAKNSRGLFENQFLPHLKNHHSSSIPMYGVADETTRSLEVRADLKASISTENESGNFSSLTFSSSPRSPPPLAAFSIVEAKIRFGNQAVESHIFGAQARIKGGPRWTEMECHPPPGLGRLAHSTFGVMAKKLFVNLVAMSPPLEQISMEESSFLRGDFVLATFFPAGKPKPVDIMHSGFALVRASYRGRAEIIELRSRNRKKSCGG